jgi:predicted ATPase
LKQAIGSIRLGSVLNESGSVVTDLRRDSAAIEPMYAFVGREKELELGRLAVDSARGGRAAFVILEGEPGVGKTRLVEELSQRAKSLGFLPAWGRCFEGRGAPPYWPWIGVIRELTRGVGRDSSPTGDRRVIDRIARYLPEIFDESPRPHILEHPGELSSSQATDQERFDLFDAISSLLRAAAQSSPLAIAIDDIHEADRDSLALLRFVVRDIVDARLLLVVTCRSQEFIDSTDVPHIMAALTRRGIRVRLSGFDRGDVAQYVHRVSGFEADDDIIAALCRATGGNLHSRARTRQGVPYGPVAATLRRPSSQAVIQSGGGFAECSAGYRVN